MSYKPALSLPMNLVELPSVGSTNDYAKQLAKKGAASGTVVWAHEQTAGRGRQGNSWVSVPGNLFMSMILRPRTGSAHVGQLSFLSAVALANVLESMLPATAQVQLKWPNDLLINQKKAAGILLESEGQGAHPLVWVVVGIGVNITGAPENAVSLHDIGPKVYEAGHILEFLAKEIQLLVRHWEADGFEPIRAAWLKRAYKLGEPITARLAKETLTGTFDGLDATGALLLKLPDGSQKVISSGEVFL